MLRDRFNIGCGRGTICELPVTPTVDEKREALELALQSRTLARSEQLRTFLRFICEAELQGQRHRLTEYIIGIEVLHKPEGYSPAEDSGVRTRAYELRHKLETLYASELCDSEVRIVLPKGAYSPQFIRVDNSNGQLQVAPPNPLSKPSAASGWSGRLILGMCLAAAALGSAITYLALRVGKPAADPIVREAWGPLGRTDADVMICAATPLHLVVGPASHQAAGSNTYPAPPETYPLFRQHRPLEPGAELGLIFTDNVLGIGTMNGIISAVNTLRSLGASYQVLPERITPISALRNHSAILFGAPVDSTAITSVLEKAPLTVDYESSIREFVIRDRDKRQTLAPSKDTSGEFVDVYGLVTVMNNRESERGKLGLVVFSGITSTGTQGAAEYFSSPGALKDLRNRLAGDGAHGFPSAYQVVVKCRFANLLLVSYEYHSHRILDKN